MVYLITLLTFLSLGFLVVLYLKNVELKEQLNKSLEENADNLSDQISFQLENFAKTNVRKQLHHKYFCDNIKPKFFEQMFEKT